MKENASGLKGQRRTIRIVGIALIGCVLLAFMGYQGLKKLHELTYPKEYSEYVEYYAGKYRIDPLIIYSVIRTESGFSTSVTSDVGARGLMQITEETFDWIKSQIAPDEPLTFDSMFDPETNIRFGTYYFAYCLLRYDDDLSTAAAAYHSGWGTVDELLAQEKYSKDGKTLDSFPYDNMAQYVEKINNAYREYCQREGNP